MTKNTPTTRSRPSNHDVPPESIVFPESAQGNGLAIVSHAIQGGWLGIFIEAGVAGTVLFIIGAPSEISNDTSDDEGES